MVQVQVKHTMGMGFVGTGAGWTLPTRVPPYLYCIVLDCTQTKPTYLELDVWARFNSI